jgi:hypothetical protein
MADQNVSFLWNSVTDPRADWVSLMPYPLKGIQQEIPSRVTRFTNTRPQYFVGRAETDDYGTCTTDGCGGGMTPPSMARIDLAMTLPFGQVKLTSSKIDFTKSEWVASPAGVQWAIFENIIRGNSSNDEKARLLDQMARTIGAPQGSLALDMSRFEFVRQFEVWRLLKEASYLMRRDTQNGNPADNPTDCYTQHHGLRTLLKPAAAMYPTLSTTALGSRKAFTAPFEVFMETGTGAAGVPLDIEANAVTFYDQLNDALNGYNYSQRYLGGVKPKLVIPVGTLMPFIKAYVKGSLGIQSGTLLTNGGADVRDQLQQALTTKVIDTLTPFGQIEVMEDETVTPGTTYTNANSTAKTAGVGRAFAEVQIIPATTINGIDVLTEEYRGYDVSGANSDTSIYGLGTAEDGRTYGRIRAVERREGVCQWWDIEYQKRLVPNMPFVLGRIPAIDIKAPAYLPQYK